MFQADNEKFDDGKDATIQQLLDENQRLEWDNVRFEDLLNEYLDGWSNDVSAIEDKLSEKDEMICIQSRIIASQNRKIEELEWGLSEA